MTLDTINDLRLIKDWPIFRRPVGAVAGGIDPRPLIAGTEKHAYPWLVAWHRDPHSWTHCDIACYSILDATIAGSGNVWLGERLVTSPEIMPPYVAQVLGIASGGNDAFHKERKHPIRTIERPCLVAVGHGIEVYGHFLIEMLFRILVARQAFQSSGLRFGILLDRSAPPWLMKILEKDLEIPPSDFEFFDSTRERVKLRHGIVPGRVFIGDRVHPCANDLLDDLLTKMVVPQSDCRRVFIVRRNFQNPAAPNRICVNEAALIRLAAEYGFEPIAPEELSWREQIAVFRDAEIVLGQAGSGLHTALFSRAGSRLASIGFMNLVQAEIGALRGQNTAYLGTGKLSGEFNVDESSFADFIYAVTMPDYYRD